MKEDDLTGSQSHVATMLRLARQLQNAGRIHKACELYFDILQTAPDSKEAPEARQMLLWLAEEYERQGKPLLALDLYQKVASH